MRFKNSIYFTLNRFIIASIIGLIIGSALDLQISHLLYLKGNIIPNFIRFTGEMPMILLAGSFSFEIIKRYLQDKINKTYPLVEIKTLIFVLAIIAFLLPIFISSKGIPTYFKDSNSLLHLYIFIFYILASVLLSLLYKDIDNKSLMKYFLFLFIIVLLTMIIMNLMKNIWTRQRYFPMREINNYKNFSFWLIPQFRLEITDAVKSFPSGHTTSATVMLALLFFPKVKDKRVKKYLSYFAIFWTIFVALGRILDGAHFLTDVSFAILMTTLIIKLADKIVKNYLEHRL